MASLKLVALPAMQSSCASVYTMAAEMSARWCAKNELGDVRAVPVCDCVTRSLCVFRVQLLCVCDTHTHYNYSRLCGTVGAHGPPSPRPVYLRADANLWSAWSGWPYRRGKAPARPCKRRRPRFWRCVCVYECTTIQIFCEYPHAGQLPPAVAASLGGGVNRAHGENRDMPRGNGAARIEQPVT